jgi:hypothetical protein
MLVSYRSRRSDLQSFVHLNFFYLTENVCVCVCVGVCTWGFVIVWVYVCVGIVIVWLYW